MPEWTAEAEAERQAYQAVRVMGDEEFFPAVLGMTYEQAKRQYLSSQ